MKKSLLVISVFLPFVLYAQQNAQWRGENRNGVYNETGLLKVWPSDGPELLWHFEGLGADQHWAHPVIHRGVLYIRHGDALMAYKVK